MKRLIAATIATLFICALTVQAQSVLTPRRVRDLTLATNTASLAAVAAADLVQSNAANANMLTKDLIQSNAAVANIATAVGARVATNAATAALAVNNGANLTNVLAAYQYAAKPATSTSALPNASGLYLAHDASGVTQYVGKANIGGTGTNWMTVILTAW